MSGHDPRVDKLIEAFEQLDRPINQLLRSVDRSNEEHRSFRKYLVVLMIVMGVETGFELTHLLNVHRTISTIERSGLVLDRIENELLGPRTSTVTR